MRPVNRIRQWIDAKPHRPIVASIAIVEIPVVIGLWITATAVDAPWWVIPTVLVVLVALVAWIFLVVAALGGGR